MTFVAPTLCVLLLSSGCANIPTFEFRGCGPVAIPEVNCKPYPLPAKVAPVPPGTPNFVEHGVELGHDEFLWVGQANQDIITHLKGARAVGTYFATCIDQHNARVRELQAEVDEQCGVPEPED